MEIPKIRKLSSKKFAQGHQKGAKRKPNGAQREPIGAQREPKGAKREPKGSQREPKGSPKGAKGRPKWGNNGAKTRSRSDVRKRSPKSHQNDFKNGPFWEPKSMKNR